MPRCANLVDSNRLKRRREIHFRKVFFFSVFSPENRHRSSSTSPRRPESCPRRESESDSWRTRAFFELAHDAVGAAWLLFLRVFFLCSFFGSPHSFLTRHFVETRFTLVHLTRAGFCAAALVRLSVVARFVLLLLLSARSISRSSCSHVDILSSGAHEWKKKLKKKRASRSRKRATYKK